MNNILSYRYMSATVPAGFLLGLLLLCAFPSHTISQPDLAPEREGLMDSDEIGIFIDGLMRAWMESNQVAGATVAVVHDGPLVSGASVGCFR